MCPIWAPSAIVNLTKCGHYDGPRRFSGPTTHPHTKFKRNPAAAKLLTIQQIFLDFLEEWRNFVKASFQRCVDRLNKIWGGRRIFTELPNLD